MSEEILDTPNPEEIQEKVVAPETEEIQGKESQSVESETTSKNGAQKRIDKITREKYEARERAERAERENVQFKARLEELSERLEKIAPANPKPKQDDFADWDSYNEALTSWNVSKALGNTQVVKPEVVEPDFNAAIGDAISRGQDKYDDFDFVVMNQNVPLTKQVLSVVAESESPEEVMYYLGKNPQKAHSLARLTSTQMHREVVKIELALSKNNVGKKVSSAPEPISPVDVGKSVSSSDVEKMTMEQYAEFRRQQKMKR